MKKIVLILFALMATVNASAQLYVGGSFSLWRDADDNKTTFLIEPEIGYKFHPDWAYGAVLGFESEKFGKLNRTAFFVAPYVRYTVLEHKIVSLFLDGGFGISSSKVKHADRVNGFQIGMTPGLAFELSNHFSFVTKFGFVGYRDKYLGTANGFGIQASTEDLSFGFHYEF